MLDIIFSHRIEIGASLLLVLVAVFTYEYRHVLAEVVKSMHTEKDGSSYCPVRISGSIVSVIYHLAAASGVYLGSVHLDMASLWQYIQHMLALILAMAGGVSVKSVSKADATEAPPNA